MIRAVIVDDESKGREFLKTLIGKHCPGVEIVANANTAASGAEVIRKLNPDLVFLDIEMPGGNGFTLLEKTRDQNFDVIFTTAYSQYAIKAIRFSALDYLLKPINPDELKAAVEKVEEKFSSKSTTRKNVDTLLSNIDENIPKKVVLPNVHGAEYVILDEIVRCTADGNYTLVVLTSGKKILVAKTLKEYEELFAEENFVRIHHAHLVNLKHVKRYIKGEGGQVELSDGSLVEVSRRKKTEFLEKLYA